MMLGKVQFNIFFNHLKNYEIIPTEIYTGPSGTELDLKAIAFFAASGFFPEQDTYWKETKWNYLDYNKQPWEYKPRKISLEAAVDEFAELFHQIVKENTLNKNVILPLSGGLDSRSLAVAMQVLDKTPYTYSYKFKGSFAETQYGKGIASAMGWEFEEFEIPPGYMWNGIEESAKINGCYAEFTHARQIAVAERLSKKGDVWLLGHWGDVLFDDMGVSSDMDFENQVNILNKKVLKKGGCELASALWKSWGLEGDFETYLHNRLTAMHSRIKINDANARVRAFKSLYWATRWTSTNLHYFEHYKPISLPYYDDRMCKLIMSFPEEHLAGRKIQIEYIKKYSPLLASISWQDKMPYNLFDFHKHLTPVHLPYRIAKKLKHLFNDKVLGKKLIQRNWEIQFLGQDNEQQLEQWLFQNEALNQIIPKNIIADFYNRFKTEDKVFWSHPVSMLLTLSVFAKQNLSKK